MDEKLNEAYWDGYNAYLNDQSVQDNPYKTDAKEEALWEQWKEGYYAAAWDD